MLPKYIARLPKEIPVIPMFRIVSQYVKAKNLPFTINRPEQFYASFINYCNYAAINN